ncbi:lipid-binding SYLF domain-containing protein [Lysobacter sp. K5869]|uniref:lipid-binding SYLF domain-containing protein n=1 Tax=Lysobacter sp. K5869 TaxID=2820808 RepID=UPI001C063440|nr:lipid-binding SYLF domain-containing protein [Lysobacter sp. K5869]QWP79272.1 lipid-binding SYLF domain-containing protein [Lysobacter sp. K5869]
MHRVLSLSLALSLGLSATAAVAGPDEDQRARDAIRVLADIQQIPESAIPDKLFDEARAIVVVPDTLKVGLVFGGRRGHGLASVKNPDGTWSNPSYIKLTGGSVGFQAGVQSSDIVLVFRGARGLDSIVNGKLTLGGDASVAAGPVGRTAAAATDGQLKAEIWSWSRARGLFAGIALDGAVLSIDDAANQAVYGAGNTPRMIFEGRASGQPSNAVVDFRDRLEEASAAARAKRTAEEQRPELGTTVYPAPGVTVAEPAGAAPRAPAHERLAPAQPAQPQPVQGQPTPLRDVPAQPNPAKVEPLP